MNYEKTVNQLSLTFAKVGLGLNLTSVLLNGLMRNYTWVFLGVAGTLISAALLTFFWRRAV